MGSKPKIRILLNGPFVVTGNVPLSEKIIVAKGSGYIFKEGRKLPQAEEYHLCRCGNSGNKPFCDGSHVTISFVGTETASRARFEDRAEVIEGSGIDLLDDNRCAYGRFCHEEGGNVWELVSKSDDPKCRDEAVRIASECPAGRLVARDKSGKIIEPVYKPSIEIIQDPEKDVSGGIFVKGNIPIESADGTLYETRNRATLCRCGKSHDKPFCDAAHVLARFKDHQ